MARKIKEGQLLVTVRFSKDDPLFSYLDKLPSRTIRSWEVKKMAMAQFQSEGKTPLVDANQVAIKTKIGDESDRELSENQAKMRQRLPDFN